jgi:hypothetical protein
MTMFIQVITGSVHDLDALDRVMQRWETDLRPGAVGFLGVTQGVTDDGRFVALARFESPEAARRNSERAEQGEWWDEVSAIVGDVAVHDCSSVHTLAGGGSDDATFVQVMAGLVKDRAKADAFLARTDEAAAILARTRPDLLGSVIAIHDDGDTYTQAAYFSSEADARAHETAPPPADAVELMAQLEDAVEVTDYLDLHHLTLR